MKYKWINNSNNKKVIIFFNGWGMDGAVTERLDVEDYDVLMFYDYNNLETNFDFRILDKYSEKYLVAWSMGVMIASLFDINYTKKIAINGTLKPIDNEFGIPERIYNITIKGFNQKSAEKFINNMFNSEFELNILDREFEEQKSELIALKQYKANMDFQYDKILISDNDKIIPTKNQTNFWKLEPNISSGHAPFILFNSWSEIL